MDSPLRKPVNTLAIVPRNQQDHRLGAQGLQRPATSQEQGIDQEVFKAPLQSILRGVDFDSNHARS